MGFQLDLVILDPLSERLSLPNVFVIIPGVQKASLIQELLEPQVGSTTAKNPLDKIQITLQMHLCKSNHKLLSQVKVIFMWDLYKMIAVKLVFILLFLIVPFGSIDYLAIIQAQKRSIHPVIGGAHIEEGVVNLFKCGHIYL